MFSSLLTLILGAAHMLLGIGGAQNFPPPLTAAEERAAFLKKSNGSAEAREKLILHNLRLVSHIVRKYYGAAKNSEDLVSIGTIGLVKAVDTFNHKNGARFATYAAKCIQNAILSQRNQTPFSALTKETKMRYRTGVAFLFADLFCDPATHHRRFLTSEITASISASFSSAEQFSLSM